MATVWIQCEAVAWLSCTSTTRAVETTVIGNPADGYQPLYDQAALDAAVAAEREACAKLCENNDMSWADHEWNNAVADCARKIRARGELTEGMVHATAPSVEAATKIGERGGRNDEGERAAFEAWIRGHCWLLSAEWDGANYRGAIEKDDLVCPAAMRTRMMWAAWRDRAALARGKQAKEE